MLLAFVAATMRSCLVFSLPEGPTGLFLQSCFHTACLGLLCCTQSFHLRCRPFIHFCSTSWVLVSPFFQHVELFWTAAQHSSVSTPLSNLVICFCRLYTYILFLLSVLVCSPPELSVSKCHHCMLGQCLCISSLFLLSVTFYIFPPFAFKLSQKFSVLSFWPSSMFA